ncbi:Hypothetical_protein [Hexamita inflata]|uniref:Hypothetical_protein n=1 Tax=Hexamita inflata TaxID=28002 RepID=A0AA86U8F7_9EUKA|nr:Hypothetical protein HINF_LOCUS32924 [Hexamita inflata]
MRGVIKRYIAEKASNYITSKELSFPKQRINYTRIFTGKNSVSLTLKQNISKDAMILYDIISNKKQMFLQPQVFEQVLQNIDLKYQFFSIRLLCNYRYSENAVKEYCVYNMTQQDKIGKIDEKGKWTKQDKEQK